VGHAAVPEPLGAERRGSRAVGGMTAPEPSHLGSRDPELWDTWRHVDAHPTLILTWSLYAGVPGLQGFDGGPQTHLGGGYEPVGGANIFLLTLLI
jgi:hypothetical protein